jgi:hypothetical protein
MNVSRSPWGKQRATLTTYVLDWVPYVVKLTLLVVLGGASFFDVDIELDPFIACTARGHTRILSYPIRDKRFLVSTALTWF